MSSKAAEGGDGPTDKATGLPQAAQEALEFVLSLPVGTTVQHVSFQRRDETGTHWEWHIDAIMRAGTLKMPVNSRSGNLKTLLSAVVYSAKASAREERRL